MRSLEVAGGSSVDTASDVDAIRLRAGLAVDLQNEIYAVWRIVTGVAVGPGWGSVRRGNGRAEPGSARSGPGAPA